MMNPVSLPMWILLVVSIGVPVHLFVNKGLAHWRDHCELSAILTMSLVMIFSRVALPLIQGGVFPAPGELATKLLFCLVGGLLFGAPIGLIFRAIVHSRKIA
jgi:uncharacterized membrane protein YczE